MAETPQERLLDVLDRFDTAMLVTRALDGALRSRPMAVAEQRPDGDLYFATSRASVKVDEIQADPQVCVTMQDADAFVSLTGTAHLVDDRAKVAELWSDAWKVWFPGGRDDPELVLLRVEASEGEYWDNQGTNKLKFAADALRAFVTGTKADRDLDPDQHGKAKL